MYGGDDGYASAGGMPNGGGGIMYAPDMYNDSVQEPMMQEPMTGWMEMASTPASGSSRGVGGITDCTWDAFEWNCWVSTACGRVSCFDASTLTHPPSSTPPALTPKVSYRASIRHPVLQTYPLEWHVLSVCSDAVRIRTRGGLCHGGEDRIPPVQLWGVDYAQRTPTTLSGEQKEDEFGSPQVVVTSPNAVSPSTLGRSTTGTTERVCDRDGYDITCSYMSSHRAASHLLLGGAEKCSGDSEGKVDWRGFMADYDLAAQKRGTRWLLSAPATAMTGHIDQGEFVKTSKSLKLLSRGYNKGWENAFFSSTTRALDQVTVMAVGMASGEIAIIDKRVKQAVSQLSTAYSKPGDCMGPQKEITGHGMRVTSLTAHRHLLVSAGYAVSSKQPHSWMLGHGMLSEAGDGAGSQDSLGLSYSGSSLYPSSVTSRAFATPLSGKRTALRLKTMRERPSYDRMLRAYDLRMLGQLRPLAVRPAACAVDFLPRNGGLLAAAAPSGVVSIVDARSMTLLSSGGGSSQEAQVRCSIPYQHSATALAASASGQMIAVGDSAGLLHVIGYGYNACSHTEVVRPPGACFSDNAVPNGIHGGLEPPQDRRLPWMLRTATPADREMSDSTSPTTTRRSQPRGESAQAPLLLDPYDTVAATRPLEAELHPSNSTLTPASLPFPAPPLLHMGLEPEGLLSDVWHQRHAMLSDRSLGIRIVPLDHRLIPNLSWTESLGHASNSESKLPWNNERTQRMFLAAKSTKSKHSAQQLLRSSLFMSPNELSDSMNMHANARDLGVSKPFARVSLRIPRFGIHSINFGRFNETPFTGLGNFLPNAYCTVALQVLYFLKPVRDALLAHLCSEEACLACETGFIFRMLRSEGGDAIEPRNFLRALRYSPQAEALGLLDPVEPSAELVLAGKIQDFLRFLLSHLHKELSKNAVFAVKCGGARSRSSVQAQPFLARGTVTGGQPAVYMMPPRTEAGTVISQTFNTGALRFYHCAGSMNTENAGTWASAMQRKFQAHCTKERSGSAGTSLALPPLQLKSDTHSQHDGTHVFTKHVEVHECQLRYPKMRRAIPFSMVLLNSLHTVSQLRSVYCEKCKGYRTQTIYQTVDQLPKILSLSAKVDTDTELDLWRSKVQRVCYPAGLLLGAASLSESNTTPSGDSETTAPPPTPSQVDDFDDSSLGGLLPSVYRRIRADFLGAQVPFDDFCKALKPHCREKLGFSLTPVARTEPWLPPVLTVDCCEWIDSEGKSDATALPKLFIREHCSDAWGIVSRLYTEPLPTTPFTPPESTEDNDTEGKSAQSTGHWRVVRRAAYRLVSVISHVTDPPEKDNALFSVNGEHLVAQVRSTDNYNQQQMGWVASGDLLTRGGRKSNKSERKSSAKHSSKTSDKGKHYNNSKGKAGGDQPQDIPHCGHSALADNGSWFTFNDFVVSRGSPPVSKQAQLSEDKRMRYEDRQVCDFSPVWKQPCVVMYMRADAEENAECAPRKEDFEMLHADDVLRLKICVYPPSLSDIKESQWKFTPLQESELKPGIILAIDTEFVCLEKERVRVDQKTQAERVIRPARMALGRVTIVRGEGPKEGVTCIDDYVHTKEPVHDYMTRFSGLVAGDLDTSSQHYLTTMKTSYSRLRALIDYGCVLVGHGLSNDFQMLNVTVPKEQVVDTLELFHLPGRRNLSLRFLTRQILRKNIQMEVHDSGEDARCALELYRAYQAAEQEGKVAEMLEGLYAYGDEHGFK